MKLRTIGIIAAAAAFAVLVALLLVPSGRGVSTAEGNDAPDPTATTVTTQGEASSSSPAPVDTRAACPAPERLSDEPYVAGKNYALDSDYMKDRVFDYIEAAQIQDPHKMLQAFRESGNPKGLLSSKVEADLAEAVKNASVDPSAPGMDMTYVVNRQVSTYDPDEEQSTADVRYIYVTPVLTTCRDGRVENRGTVPDVTKSIETIWIREGSVWRLVGGDIPGL